MTQSAEQNVEHVVDPLVEKQGLRAHLGWVVGLLGAVRGVPHR